MDSEKDGVIPNTHTATSHGGLALQYQAEYGLNIIPGFPGSKEPYKVGPGHSYHVQATQGVCMTPQEIIWFWERNPTSNILMFPGSVSGVDVIDVDNKPGKKSGFETLEEQGLSWVIDEGRKVFTPTGDGLHLYFKHTDDWGINRKLIPLGLEVFWAGNGYVVMPPSIVENTFTGEWGWYSVNPTQYSPHTMGLDGLKPIPDELVQFFLERGSKSHHQKKKGFAPKGQLDSLESSYPKPGTIIHVPTKTIRQLGLESVDRQKKSSKLNHLAKNTEYPSKVRAFKAEADQLHKEMNQLKYKYRTEREAILSDNPGCSAQDIETALKPISDDMNILQMSFNRLHTVALRALTSLKKNRYWYELEDGWIFRRKDDWYWVGMPGTKHNGVEYHPSPEELRSIRGKGNGKYIVRDDGTTIVRFQRKRRGKPARFHWYLLHSVERYDILKENDFL